MLKFTISEKSNIEFDISIFEIDKQKNLVNITKIAKYFNKRVNDWRQLPSTKRFLEAFFNKNPLQENLVTIQGGTNQGTWVSKKLAIKFAEWISVDFEVYANEQLDKLFNDHTIPKKLTVQDLLKLNTLTIQKLENRNKFLESQNTKLASRDLEVKTKKEYKWKEGVLKNDIGVTINFYVMKYYKKGGISYSTAHNKAKSDYKYYTGVNLPDRASKMSIKQKQAYLEWLSKKASLIKG